MNRPKGKMLIVSAAWVLGTFALHCWLLYALDSLPSYQVVRSGSLGRLAAVNRAIAPENATDPESQAQARAAMAFQDKRLSQALSAQESAEMECLTLASNTDVAAWRVSTRAWISWAVVALTPIIFLASIYLRNGLTSDGNFSAPAPTGE